MSAFSPFPKGTLLMNVTSTNSSINLPGRPTTVRIYNGGTKTAYIEVGAAAVVPTGATLGSNTGAMPLAAGAGSIPLLLEVGAAATLQAICAGTDTTTLYVTLGYGDTVG